MTVIQTTCESCGDVTLLPSRMQLVEQQSSASMVGARTYCLFHCPQCGRPVRKQIGDTTRASLLRAGVPLERRPGSNLSSFGHPEDPPDGPPFTLDDLLDLHLLLESDDWFDRCTAGTP